MARRPEAVSIFLHCSKDEKAIIKHKVMNSPYKTIASYVLHQLVYKDLNTDDNEQYKEFIRQGTRISNNEEDNTEIRS